VTKSNAETSFWAFNAKYFVTYKLYSDNIVNKNDIPKETIIEVLSSANSTLDALRNHLHDVKDMLDNSIPAATLTDDTLNNMKMQVTTMLSNLEQVILSPT
jgi:ABC-type transporter Mla subunit MlaD